VAGTEASAGASAPPAELRGESRLGFLIGCNGGIYALRRELYQSLRPSTNVEDFVFSMRVLEQGYDVRFEPRLSRPSRPRRALGTRLNRPPVSPLKAAASP